MNRLLEEFLFNHLLLILAAVEGGSNNLFTIDLHLSFFDFARGVVVVYRVVFALNHDKVAVVFFFGYVFEGMVVEFIVECIHRR